jgi:hypothetical protein
MRTAFGEHFADRRFAAGDTASEAYAQHWTSRCGDVWLGTSMNKPHEVYMPELSGLKNGLH